MLQLLPAMWTALAVITSLAPAQRIPVSSSGPQSPGSGRAWDGGERPWPPVLPAIPLTSPGHREEGVSLNRETIVYFDPPLATPPGAVAAAFEVLSAGSLLGFQARLSTDARRVTLFYNQPLPSNQRVRVTVDGSLLYDELGMLVDADGDGERGGILAFEFDTIAIDPYPGTAVTGRVFASELAMGGGSINVPLEGVTVSVDGAETTLFAITDSKGNFRLDPAPAGRFFVHIDGTTATDPVPPGTFYPKVGKAYETRPGEEVNMGDAFLPLVPDGTMNAVSQTEDVTMSFAPSVLAAHPELAGTEITVPAGSLFYDNGAPGTMVGIAPVPSDRLPGPLPAGLEFPIVITVQTDGATNFDAPISVRFPNLPVPSTGQPLPAGSRASVWSFNHDASVWEAVAPARVTQDGLFIETVAGGIVAPGWHGFNPGMQGEGEAMDPCTTNCGATTLTSILDCAWSLGSTMAGLKCPSSVISGAAQVARDCAIDSGNAGLKCAKSAIINAAGAAIGCYPPFALVGLGWSCGFAVIQAFQACTCTDDLILSRGIAEYQAHLDLMFAVDQVYQQLLGSAVWTSSIDPAVGDPRAEMDLYDAIIDGLDVATDLTSDGGLIVTMPERSALHSLPLPSGVSSTDVDELVDYSNATATFWGMGVFTHAQAGQAGFMDRDQFLASLDQLESALGALVGTGTNQVDFRGSLLALLQHELDSVVDAAEPLVPPSHVLYSLVNETDSLVHRGRLGLGGNFGSVSLRPSSYYRATLLDTRTLQVGASAMVPEEFIEPRVIRCRSVGGGGLALDGCGPPPVANLPRVGLFPPEDDFDGDGLSQRGEFVVGTNAALFDTDGDGIGDGAEVLQNLNPLDDLVAATGVIATAPGAAVAEDVSAFGDLAAVARGLDGVSIYNVFNGMPPVLVALIDTSGDARAVALGDRYLLVADGGAGLAVIDLVDPLTAGIVHQLPPVALGGGVISVAIAGELGFAGTSTGNVVSLDLASGAVLDIVPLTHAVHDLAVEGEWLFALTESTLSSLRLFHFPLTVEGQISAPGNTPVSTRRRRLFVGGGIAYATDMRGYDTYDVSTPARPAAIGGGDTQQVGWTQIVTNGTGFGVAAVGPNAGIDSLHDLALYDASDPAQTNDFLVSYETPGAAVSLSIYGGLAYVADYGSGLQVVNYMPYDADGIPPALSIAVTPNDVKYEEGTVLLVTSSVMDDVQVRSVELQLDGTTVQTDGNFPFQFYLSAPDFVRMGVNLHSLAVRASDTGGNTTTSAPHTFGVVQDGTGPTVIATQPAAMANVPPDYFTVFGVVLSASEQLDPQSLSPSSVTFLSSGPDLMFGGMDDVAVPTTVTTVANDRRVVVRPGAAVPVGILRVLLEGSLVADRAGNLLDGDQNGMGGDDFQVELQVTQEVDRFWDGGGDGTTWTNALNWSGNALPGPSDDVLIDSPGTSVVYAGGVTTVQSLTSRQPITINNGAISISQTSNIDATVTISNNNSSLFLNGGGHTIRSLVLNSSNTPLDGSGDLTVTQSMAWNGGRLAGSGDVVVLSGATMTTPSTFAGDQERALTNHGRIVLGMPGTWNKLAPLLNALDGVIETNGSGTMNLQGAGTLTNKGQIRVLGGTLNAAGTWVNHATIEVASGTLRTNANYQNNGVILVSASAQLELLANTFTSNGTINSQGTVLLAGGGAAKFINGPFVSSGTLRATSGNTTFAAGQLQQTGPVEITGGAVTFNDTFTPSSWSGVGAGQVTFNAPMTLPSLTLNDNNSKLQGLGNVTITGSVTWSAGEMLGSGRTILPSGATMSLPGGAFVVLYRTLENHGVITHSGNFFRLTQSGGIENASDGTLILNGESDLDHVSPTATFISNAGILRHAGAGTSVLAAITVANTGTIEVQAGTLRIVQGWTNAGSIEIDAGAIVRTEGRLTLASSSLVRTQLVSPSSLGLLQTTANAALGGTLELLVDGGYTPVVNDTFDVATYGTHSSTFAAIQGTDLGGGLMLVPSYLGNTLRLTVQ